MTKCVWREFESDDCDWWDTGCAHAYTIIEGTPLENEMKYCTYCGKEIEEILIETLPDEEDD